MVVLRGFNGCYQLGLAGSVRWGWSENLLDGLHGLAVNLQERPAARYTVDALLPPQAENFTRYFTSGRKLYEGGQASRGYVLTVFRLFASLRSYVLASLLTFLRASIPPPTCFRSSVWTSGCSYFPTFSRLYGLLPVLPMSSRASSVRPCFVLLFS